MADRYLIRNAKGNSFAVREGIDRKLVGVRINGTRTTAEEVANEIVPSDLQDFSIPTIKKILSKLSSAANIRVAYAQGRIELPRSYSGEKFGIKHLNLKKGDSVENESINRRKLISEYARVREFILLKTTKVREYKIWKSQIQTKILQNVLPTDENAFWDMYKELYHDNRLFEKFKYETFDVIRNEIISNANFEEVREGILKRLLQLGSIDESVYNEYVNSSLGSYFESDED